MGGIPVSLITLVLCIFHILLFQHLANCYELNLDQGKDVVLWKFQGSYAYSPNGEELEGILTSGNSAVTHVPAAIRDDEVLGIWSTKFSPSRRRGNKLIISYTLKHALCSQVWIRFLSDPGTSVLVKTNNEMEMGRFWSDGISWCDAVINVGLHTMVTLEVETPSPGNFFLLDKVVLGIFSNITQLNGRTLNLCHTRPQPTVNNTNRLVTSASSSTPPPPIISDETNVMGQRNPSIQNSENLSFSRGGGETRNTRNSVFKEEQWPVLSSTAPWRNPIEFTKQPEQPSTKTITQVFQKGKKFERSTSSRVILNPPTREAFLHLANPVNITLRDYLEELPVSDGVISSTSNQKSPLDLKCECSCSCKP